MRFLTVAVLFGLACHAPIWGQPISYPNSEDAGAPAEAAEAAADDVAAAAEETAAAAEEAARAIEEAAFRAALREWQTLFRSDQGSVFQARLGDWLKVGPETIDEQVWIKVDHSRPC